MAREDNFHLGIKALIRDESNQVLLLKVNVSALKKHNGDPYWDIPGGRMQKGDTPEIALRREVQEETGMTNIVSFEYFTAALSNIRIPIGDDSVGLILFAYLCNVSKPYQILLSEEHIEYGWFSPCEAAKLLEFKYPAEFLERLKHL
jgi:8-oxo-dGTP pyrophosphatase MutT (NUDIX family)